MDEVEQSQTRLTLRAPGERLTAMASLHRIYEAEVPVKSVELSADKAQARAELGRTLGTLRYLRGVREQQQRRKAVATTPLKQQQQQQQHKGKESGADAAGPSQPCQVQPAVGAPATAAAFPAPETESCPVCHEALGDERSMLACGHQLCTRCSLVMADRIPSNVPQVRQVISKLLSFAGACL